MTIQEVLTNFDTMKPNQFDEGTKLAWLNEIEQKVYHTMSQREGEVRFHIISTESDYSESMLLPELYTNIYSYYLGSMVDYYNGETTRYNNSVIMFDTAYGEFENYWYREHRQKSDGRFGR